MLQYVDAAGKATARRSLYDAAEQASSLAIIRLRTHAVRDQSQSASTDICPIWRADTSLQLVRLVQAATLRDRALCFQISRCMLPGQGGL